MQDQTLTGQLGYGWPWAWLCNARLDGGVQASGPGSTLSKGRNGELVP